MNKIEELAKELKENWVRGLTLSGRIRFLENEKGREMILAQAEEWGIRQEVYKRANEMMKGK